MTQENRIWVLISRRLSGEATAEEAEELRLLLEQSPERQYQLNLLHSYFSQKQQDALEDQNEGDADLERRFLKIVDQPADLPRTKTRILSLISGKFAAAAAIGGLLLITGLAIYRSKTPAPASASPIAHDEEVLTKAGTRTRLVLPDGTQVWLNSSSKLRYSDDFNTKNREVSLEGEGYFEVAKNVNHPFIVHASSLDVTVLGTSFTVKSYPQDPTVEATLLNGVIEVTRMDKTNPAQVILRPNEKLVFNKLLPVRATTGSHDSTRFNHLVISGIAVNRLPQNIPDSNKVETSWLYNRLVFDGDRLPELAAKMERWYNVKITLKDKSLADLRFGGAFANESIEEALKALQLTANFTYKIKGNEIELYEKQ